MLAKEKIETAKDADIDLSATALAISAIDGGTK